jgi:hypothetical protein
MKVTSARDGFALPAAVGAMVIIGVLVTAGFYMAQQEVRIGIASSNAQLAFYLAERGANDVVNDWSASTMLNMSRWSDTTLTDTLDIGAWSVTARRLGTRLFYLDATGTVTQGGTQFAGASRRSGLIVRLFSADIAPPGALTTRGPTYLKGTAEVHGEDIYPDGWSSVCTNSLTDKPGIVAQDTADVRWEGSDSTDVVTCSYTGLGVSKITTCDTTSGGSNISGTPELMQDSLMVDSTFTTFGDMTWDDLVSLADKTVTSLGSIINATGPDSTAGGGCVTATLTNWGNPEGDVASACADYFPIIYHGGPSLRIQSGGTGQGILLVDGGLDLRGGFVFNGVVIVQGSFETQGSGNRILGGVMASNVDLTEQSLVGGSQVQYSTCALERAILGNDGLTRARPLTIRIFIDLSSVIN